MKYKGKNKKKIQKNNSTTENVKLKHRHYWIQFEDEVEDGMVSTPWYCSGCSIKIYSHEDPTYAVTAFDLAERAEGKVGQFIIIG